MRRVIVQHRQELIRPRVMLPGYARPTARIVALVRALLLEDDLPRARREYEAMLESGKRMPDAKALLERFEPLLEGRDNLSPGEDTRIRPSKRSCTSTRVLT